MRIEGLVDGCRWFRGRLPTEYAFYRGSNHSRQISRNEGDIYELDYPAQLEAGAD